MEDDNLPAKKGENRGSAMDKVFGLPELLEKILSFFAVKSTVTELLALRLVSKLWECLVFGAFKWNEHLPVKRFFTEDADLITEAFRPYYCNLRGLPISVMLNVDNMLSTDTNELEFLQRFSANIVRIAVTYSSKNIEFFDPKNPPWQNLELPCLWRVSVLPGMGSNIYTPSERVHVNHFLEKMTAGNKQIQDYEIYMLPLQPSTPLEHQKKQFPYGTTLINAQDACIHDLKLITNISGQLPKLSKLIIYSYQRPFEENYDQVLSKLIASLRFTLTELRLSDDKVLELTLAGVHELQHLDFENVCLEVSNRTELLSNVLPKLKTMRLSFKSRHLADKHVDEILRGSVTYENLKTIFISSYQDLRWAPSRNPDANKLMEMRVLLPNVKNLVQETSSNEYADDEIYQLKGGEL